MDSEWAWLPYHVLDSILEKLESSRDHIQFGAICKAWHYTLTTNPARKRLNMSNQVPMLVFRGGENEHATASLLSLYDPMNDVVLGSKLVAQCTERISSSSEGWLVSVNEDFTVTLFNPFSIDENTATIHLPCLFPPDPADFEPEDIIYLATKRGNHVFKAVITADPVTYPDDCIILVIYGQCYGNLAFIRPAKDATWTKVDTQVSYFHDILFYNSEFYAVDCGGATFSFRITDSCSPTAKMLTSSCGIQDSFKFYLVKSYQGELWLVQRYVDWDEDELSKRKTMSVRVWRLDFESPTPTWVEIKSLRNNALFLGDNSSISVLASNIAGCKPNCIYFTHDQDALAIYEYGPCDLGAYSFECQSYTVQYVIDSVSTKQPPLWLVPTLNA